MIVASAAILLLLILVLFAAVKLRQRRRGLKKLPDFLATDFDAENMGVVRILHSNDKIPA